VSRTVTGSRPPPIEAAQEAPATSGFLKGTTVGQAQVSRARVDLYRVGLRRTTELGKRLRQHGDQLQRRGLRDLSATALHRSPPCEARLSGYVRRRGRNLPAPSTTAGDGTAFRGSGNRSNAPFKGRPATTHSRGGRPHGAQPRSARDQALEWYTTSSNYPGPSIHPLSFRDPSTTPPTSYGDRAALRADRGRFRGAGNVHRGPAVFGTRRIDVKFAQKRGRQKPGPPRDQGPVSSSRNQVAPANSRNQSSKLDEHLHPGDRGSGPRGSTQTARSVDRFFMSDGNQSDAGGDFRGRPPARDRIHLGGHDADGAGLRANGRATAYEPPSSSGDPTPQGPSSRANLGPRLAHAEGCAVQARHGGAARSAERPGLGEVLV